MGGSGAAGSAAAAAAAAAGKQIITVKAGQGVTQPQIVTLVKTTQGMQVAQVWLNGSRLILCSHGFGDNSVFICGCYHFRLLEQIRSMTSLRTVLSHQKIVSLDLASKRCGLSFGDCSVCLSVNVQCDVTVCFLL